MCTHNVICASLYNVLCQSDNYTFKFPFENHFSTFSIFTLLSSLLPMAHSLPLVAPHSQNSSFVGWFNVTDYFLLASNLFCLLVHNMCIPLFIETAVTMLESWLCFVHSIQEQLPSVSEWVCILMPTQTIDLPLFVSSDNVLVDVVHLQHWYFLTMLLILLIILRLLWHLCTQKWLLFIVLLFILY